MLRFPQLTSCSLANLFLACASEEPGEAAIAWASIGVPVLPNWPATEDGGCTCSRLHCTCPGKHPLGALVPHGIDDATTDQTIIRQHWALWPDANPGLLMGTALVALDVDPRYGGDRTLAELQNDHEPLPADTLIVETGGGGQHWLFCIPVGDLFPNFHLGPGLEFKGSESQIIAAGSRHASGRHYRIANAAMPTLLPDWLSVIARSEAEQRHGQIWGATRTPRRPRIWRGRPLSHLSPAVRERAEEVKALLLSGPHAEEAARLIAGDPTANTMPDKSYSGADHRLGRLAKRHTRDPLVIEELLRSTGLARKKYNRPDYLPRTIHSVLEDDPEWQRQQKTQAERKVSRRGVRVRPRVMKAILHYVAEKSAESGEPCELVQLPVRETAIAEEVSDELVRLAVNDLAALGVINTDFVTRSQPSGFCTRERFVKLTVPLPEALAAIEPGKTATP